MSTPTPRPALKKAADAHIHPAAPGHSPGGLRPASDTEGRGAATAAPGPGPDATPQTSAGPTPHRLSGPPAGATSDSLRTRRSGRRGGDRPAKQEKTVPLDVKVPKSLRKDLRAAAKTSKRTPDEIVTALLRGWLDG